MTQGYGSIPGPAHEGDHGGARSTDSSKRPQRLKIILSSFVALAVLGYGGYVAFNGSPDMAITFQRSSNDVRLIQSKREYLLDNDLDSTPLWHEQYMDHIGEDTERWGPKLKTFNQRFLKKSVHFKGPGHPILVIMGGEGSLDPPMLYQFVHDGLAEEFGAFVLSPEHRFYGQSRPIENPSVKDLVKYLTPDQALADAVNMIQTVRDELGCSTDPTSKKYCPVITFGGSYPGFLSAMLRFRYGDYVDIGYASSAPLELYSQVANSNLYFEKVTEVADTIASPGCANAVRSTLFAIQADLIANYTSVRDAAKAMGFCLDKFPTYMKDVPEFVSETVIYLVPAVFADFNMGFYPPGPYTELAQGCKIFQDDSLPPMKRYANFFLLRAEVEGYYKGDEEPDCFDLNWEIPNGPNARVRGSDNSGTGGGYDGEMWEFQCCKDLIIRAGYSEQSMFIPRHFSYDWHKEHCHERFPGIHVEPYRMAEQWEFDDLSGVTRLLFVNGLNDGWSTSSILKTENPHIEIINLPNGAHHSELRRHYPDPADTDDVKDGHETVKRILGTWLHEIYSKQDHK